MEYGPAPSPAPAAGGSRDKQAGNINVLVLVIALVLGALAAITMLVGFMYYRHSRRRKSAMETFAQQSEKSTECMLKPTSAANSYNPTPTGTPAKHFSPAPQSGPQILSYQELQIATNNFSRYNIIGQGGFGTVYRGVLPNGRIAAVKQLESGGKQGEEEFQVEVETLSRVRSPYLLELLGYCDEDDHRVLVYEYMANGNLQQHLYPEDERFIMLDWTTRMRIALDAAKGLEYLHEFISPPIIHRDFKCSNILLDDNLNAKLCDFGLAKVGSDKLNGDVSTRVLGTHGYVAPEYVLTGHLTTKSDVYSFGVVLLELLTGRVPVDMKRPPGEGILVTWALPRLTDRDKLDEMVDPVLQGQYSMKELIQVAAIAAMCVQPEADYRPLMIDVVQSLTPLARQRTQRQVSPI